MKINEIIRISDIQWMSEYGTTEIQTVLKLDQTGVRNLDSFNQQVKYIECLNTEQLKFKLLCWNRNWREFGIQTVRIPDIRAFGTTPQLSEIQTDHPHHNTTFKCHY